jgi:transcriptional regulator with XRE-family HTH domain
MRVSSPCNAAHRVSHLAHRGKWREAPIPIIPAYADRHAGASRDQGRESIAMRESLHVRIRAARIAAGQTQTELARALGITRASISQWESGLTIPTIEHLVRLAQATGRPLAWFAAEDSGATAHERDAAPTEMAQQLARLPAPLRTVAQWHIDRLLRYAASMPAFLLDGARPPDDPTGLAAWIAELERDICQRLGEPAQPATGEPCVAG